MSSRSHIIAAPFERVASARLYNIKDITSSLEIKRRRAKWHGTQPSSIYNKERCFSQLEAAPFLFCSRSRTHTRGRHHQLIFSEAIDALELPAGVMKRLFNYQMKEREERMANDNKLKFAADAPLQQSACTKVNCSSLVIYALALSLTHLLTLVNYSKTTGRYLEFLISRESAEREN